MAFFKFRFPGGKAGGDPVAPSPPESVEGLRRRARHRLIGAAVLVLAAVMGFPLLFDTQPRPVAVDVPIQIPDRAKAKPLAMPVPVPQAPASALMPVPPVPAMTSSATQAVAAAGSGSDQVAAPASLSAKEELVANDSGSKQAKPSVAGSSSAIHREAIRELAAASKPEVKADGKVPPKAQAAVPADDGSRARALLDGKEPSKPAAVDAGRFIVQVGAFSDPVLARETRLKVERAGLTTYTQVVDTKEGKRIRVRVGPFTSRAEADKAAGKIRGLALHAAILTL